jgi:hypothetical protein
MATPALLLPSLPDGLYLDLDAAKAALQATLVIMDAELRLNRQLNDTLSRDVLKVANTTADSKILQCTYYSNVKTLALSLCSGIFRNPEGGVI